MKAKYRIGILGGSFDPVHWGHILLAREALQFADLDFVLLLVAKDPPHKMVHTSPEDRFRMACLAVEGEAGIYASDLELRMPGKTYAVDVMREVKRHYPDAELFYLVGSDVLETLQHWYRSEELLSLVKILCAVRKNPWSMKLDSVLKMQQEQKLPVQIIHVDIPDISSTMIRSFLRKNVSISSCVPGPVEKYILDNRLYQHIALSEDGCTAAIDGPHREKQQST